MTLEEPTGYEEEAEPVDEAEEAETGTDQDLESDSDEEETLEPVAEGQGRRYPLRERHVLLTDEGEPESFEEAKNHTHSRKWLSAM